MRASSRRWSTTVISLLVFLAGASAASSADVWAVGDQDAVALLPPPLRSRNVDGARLSCAEQRWTLALDLAPGTEGDDGARQARLDVRGDSFDLEAQRGAGKIDVSLPSDVLPPLRAGVRMDISVAGGPQTVSARFSLIGSRRAIDAVVPRCSKRDMSAYRLISPSELNPETAIARELLADEIRAFRAATKSKPRVAAVLEAAGDERQLLFATLCGSSWYYGNSGCNLTVHAREGATGSWNLAHESEGVAIHVDPGPTETGWPDLVALTFDGDEIVWRWNDGAYTLPYSAELRGG